MPDTRTGSVCSPPLRERPSAKAGTCAFIALSFGASFFFKQKGDQKWASADGLFSTSCLFVNPNLRSGVMRGSCFLCLFSVLIKSPPALQHNPNTPSPPQTHKKPQGACNPHRASRRTPQGHHSGSEDPITPHTQRDVRHPTLPAGTEDMTHPHTPTPTHTRQHPLSHTSPRDNKTQKPELRAQEPNAQIPWRGAQGRPGPSLSRGLVLRPRPRGRETHKCHGDVKHPSLQTFCGRVFLNKNGVYFLFRSLKKHPSGFHRFTEFPGGREATRPPPCSRCPQPGPFLESVC